MLLRNAIFGALVAMSATAAFAQNGSATVTAAQNVPGTNNPFGDLIQKAAAGNVNTNDAYVSLFNSGTIGGFDTNGLLTPKGQGGTTTTHVYVFDASDEQLVACCSCQLTPDAGATLSVKNQLINNPGNGVIPASVTITLINSAGTWNDGSLPGPLNNAAFPGPLAGGLRATRTHTHLSANYAGVTSPFVTESDFKGVTLSASEFNRITNLCLTFGQNGSGKGICGTGAGAGPLGSAVACTQGVSNAITKGHK